MSLFYGQFVLVFVKSNVIVLTARVVLCILNVFEIIFAVGKAAKNLFLVVGPLRRVKARTPRKNNFF